MIRFTCTSCHKRLKSSAANAGKSAKCPNCNMQTTAPHETERGRVDQAKGNANLRVFTAPLSGGSTFNVKVVGTSYCQAALRALSRPFQRFQSQKQVACTLISEPRNTHDSNAVKVKISGYKVGYLSRGHAAELKCWLEAQGYSGIEADVSGMIIGPGIVDEDEYEQSGEFWVRIDACTPVARRVTPVGDSADFEFTPKLQSDIHLDDSGSWIMNCPFDEFLPVLCGDRVRFWHPQEDPSRLFIYLRGSCGGSGKLGFVPDRFNSRIFDHLASNLTVNAVISRIENGICFIRCKLASASEVEQQRRAEVEKLHAELSKSYRPKKPIKGQFDSADMFSTDFKRGTVLIPTQVPSVNECAEDLTRAVFTFSRDDATGLLVCLDNSLKKKIVRLGDLLYSCTIKIQHRYPGSTSSLDDGRYVKRCTYDVEIKAPPP